MTKMNLVTFDVVRTGTVGITTDAKVTLKVNKDTPDTLYYRLDPVYESDVPVEKQEIISDSDVISNNEIIRSSVYSGTFPLGLVTNTFSYTVSETRESVLYFLQHPVFLMRQIVLMLTDQSLKFL